MSLNSSTPHDKDCRDGLSGAAEPSAHVDGSRQDATNRIRVDELKKSIRDLLDGDSMSQYETFEKFNEWLSVVLAYEDAEEGDDSALLLPVVFQELKAEAESNEQVVSA
ncbi:hypothetical protein RYA05_02835 [Pseudomonas syringae pv. actinidiae]|nr:hypothetical protein [Pseudomonas syringae pv. actinidiae]